MALALIPIAVGHCTPGPNCSASSGAGGMRVGRPVGHKWIQQSAFSPAPGSLTEWVGGHRLWEAQEGAK